MTEAALAAIDAGFPTKGDEILIHAVHAGLTASEVAVELTRHAARSTPTARPPHEEAAPMQVTYTGPDAGVRLAPAAGDIWCPHGEPVDVPDEIGRSLCTQADFEPATTKRRRLAPAQPPEAEGETPESTDPTMETRHGTEGT